MTRKGLILWIGAAVVALAQTAPGQRPANWRVYKMRDGLPDTTCLAATFSPQGKIFVKHLNAPTTSELDGYTITNLPSPPGGGKVYESPGGQLWSMGTAGLQEMKDGAWISHAIPELVSFLSLRPNDLPLIHPVRQGVVLCLLPSGLLELNSSETGRMQASVLRSAHETRIGNFSGMIPSRDGGLWILGANGLAKVPALLRNLKQDTEWQEHIPDAQLQVGNLRQPHEDFNGGVSMIAQTSSNHEPVILYFDGHNSWLVRQAPDSKIRHAWRGPDGTWWAASATALFHSENEQGDLLETDEISARQYFDIAFDPTGPFWLATSDGLFRFAPLIWRNSGWGTNSGSLIHCLSGDSQDRLWFISVGGLHLIQKGRQIDFSFANSAAQDFSTAQCLFPLKDGSVVLGGDAKIIQFQPTTGNFNLVSNVKQRENYRALGLLKDGRVCLESWRGAQESNYSLQAFDGKTLQPLPCPAPDGSLGIHLTTFFEAQNGALWIGAEHGTAYYHEKQWKIFSAADKSSPDSPLAFVEMADGKIWCATSDKLWEFDGRDWTEVRRGFDRINAILRTQRDGSVWVASNGGLHRFTVQGAWLDNGTEEGLPSMSVRALYEDARGRLWAGTTRGLSQYDPEADRDPPQTEIESLPDVEGFREGTAITLSFTGKDKWKYTPRERLLFSHRMDEREWSSFEDEKQITYNELLPGKHSFQVRTMDRNGNVDQKPAAIVFAIVLPWYKETRLVLISLAGVAIALFFAGLAFNRHHQLVRSYDQVEKQVTERTRELEVASRELLHSQKMNALGTLAAGIAHDFNNILSIIKGSAQIIEDNMDNPQKVRTRVDRIKTVVEQGSGIVKAMLGFSRESDQQPGVCAPNSVVEDTIKLLGDRFLREVQVRFQKGADTALVKCPKDFVQQILINFIFNAAESMDSQKEITLMTRESATLPRELVLAPVSAPNYVFVMVRDTGCGIPPENMARIFEPFFTTKSLSDRRGTGLGLSMVYELARKMEAGLAVESIVGKGSTFTLILPAVAATFEKQLEMADIK